MMSAAGQGIRAHRPIIGRAALLGALAAAFTVLLPAAAQANNLFSIDPQATSTGPVVTDSSGTAYVAWNRTAANSSQTATPMFCKIPRGGTCTDPIELPLPPSSEPSYEVVVQPFPVLGTQPNVVYVVGPRYIRSDNLIWSSTNGGKTFSLKKPQGTYAGDTGVGDVLLAPGGSINTTPSGSLETNNAFEIASDNVGVGYSFTGNNIEHVEDSSFSFNEPGSFTAGSTLGLINTSETSGVVEAYWTDTSPVQVRVYTHPTEGLAIKQAAGWSAHPDTVTDGYLPRLAGGPKGLFLLSEDYLPGESTAEAPTVLELRKFNEAANEFEAPVVIARDSSAGSDESGGIYENPETGALYVAWPETSGGEYVMKLWESTDGGQTFHGERNIAAIGFAYDGPPRLAVAADGQGWLTFKDAGGLEVADLNALSTPTPISTPSPGPAATTVTTSQTSGTTTSANITIPAGTVGETDHATIVGTNASSATGTVTYDLYSQSGCPASSVVFSSTTAVTSGVATPSTGVTSALAPGRYYWVASYSGNSTNAASASACGSEVLTVTPAATIGGEGESTSTTITLTITCASSPCTVTITITVPSPSGKASAARKSKKHPKTKIVTLGTRTFTLTTNGPHKLTVQLSKAGKKLLAADHGRLNAKILVAEKTPGGTVLSTRTIKIVPAKPKHNKK
jgi:hypothetical protein